MQDQAERPERGRGRDLLTGAQAAYAQDAQPVPGAEIEPGRIAHAGHHRDLEDGRQQGGEQEMHVVKRRVEQGVRLHRDRLERGLRGRDRLSLRVAQAEADARGGAGHGGVDAAQDEVAGG